MAILQFRIGRYLCSGSCVSCSVLVHFALIFSFTAIATRQFLSAR